MVLSSILIKEEAP